MTAPARAAVLPAAAARIRARKPAWFTTAACAALLGCFALLSASAARTKSATADEPLHLMGGFMHRNYLDFSVNIEDPALFGWLFAIPLPKDLLQVNRESISYRQIPTDIGNQAFFNWQTLYKT